jgi:hypothetical protein
VPRRVDTGTAGAGAGAVVEVGLQEHVGTAKVARIKEKGHRSNCQAGERAMGGWVGKYGR